MMAPLRNLGLHAKRCDVHISYSNVNSHRSFRKMYDIDAAIHFSLVRTIVWLIIYIVYINIISLGKVASLDPNFSTYDAEDDLNYYGTIV